MKHVDELRINEGSKISQREIEDVFAFSGFELTKIQLDELLAEMASGTAFNRHRFQKWIYKNNQFLALIPTLIP